MYGQGPRLQGNGACFYTLLVSASNGPLEMGMIDFISGVVLRIEWVNIHQESV